MGFFKNAFMSTFHPNKIKREVENAAEAQRQAINQKAAAEREKAQLRKNANLAAIEAVCNDVQAKINMQHQEELSQANEEYTEKKHKYTAIIDHLKQLQQQHDKQIIRIFNELKEQLIINRQLDQQRVLQCHKKVIYLANKIQYHSQEHKLLLDRLWRQAAEAMLQQDCITAYQQLRQPIKQDITNSKNYSLLVGYFKQLATQNTISTLDGDRYKRFLYLLCNAKNNLEHNKDFNTIDNEIINLLQTDSNNNKDILANAYQQDYNQHQNAHNNSIIFNTILQEKIVILKKNIEEKYEQSIVNLTVERDQKQQTLQEHYIGSVKQADNEWLDYQIKHNNYINTLNTNKVNKITELAAQKQQEQIKINEQYQQELQTLAAEIRKILQDIDNNLDEQIKQIKRAHKASIINAFTTITAGAATWFSGGLLAGASSQVIASVDVSLITTSLGALERLINNKEKIGLNISANICNNEPIKDFKLKATNSNSVNNSILELQPNNLYELKNKFKKFNQEVQFWQVQAEHDLFYTLSRGVSSFPQVSDAVMAYSSRVTNNINFFGKASLGERQTNGFRIVTWDGTLDQHNQLNGKYLMRDSDLFNIIHKLSNNSRDVLKKEWDKPQILQFNQSWLQKFVSSPNFRVIDQAQSSNTSSSFTPNIDKTTVAAPHSETVISKWQIFKENYVVITNDTDATEDLIYRSQSKEIVKLYNKYQVGTRLSGGLQAGFGVGQLSLATALAETGVGIVPASLLAVRGSDNFTTGSMRFATGQDRPTILYQAARSVGISDTVATWLEFGVDLSPVVQAVCRGISDIAKSGILKLYDLRAARQPTISASTPAEIAWGTGKLSSRQTTLLGSLPKLSSQITLYKSDINVIDLSALTAYTGDEFAMFTRGSQRLIIRGHSSGVNLSKEKLKSLKEQGFKLSAHTHPTNTTLSRSILDASGGDRLTLTILEQERSLILDSLGRRNIFDQTDNLSTGILESLRCFNNNFRKPRPCN